MKEIYAYSLRLLLRKNYFVQEMVNTLEKKFPDENVMPVVEQLIQDKYLDDERFFRNFVRWKIESGYGQYYIKEKLRQKGVAKSINEIDDIIKEEELDIDTALRNAVKKYIRTRRKKTPEAFMRSCINYLAGKGFATSDAIKIFKEEVSNESDFFEGC